MKLIIGGLIAASLGLAGCQAKFGEAIATVNTVINFVCDTHTVYAVREDTPQKLKDFASFWNMMVATLCPPTDIAPVVEVIGE